VSAQSPITPAVLAAQRDEVFEEATRIRNVEPFLTALINFLEHHRIHQCERCITHLSGSDPAAMAGYVSGIAYVQHLLGTIVKQRRTD